MEEAPDPDDGWDDDSRSLRHRILAFKSLVYVMEAYPKVMKRGHEAWSLVKPNRSPGGVRLSDWSYSVTPVVLGIGLRSIIARKAITLPESCTPGPLHA